MPSPTLTPHPPTAPEAAPPAPEAELAPETLPPAETPPRLRHRSG